MRCRIDAMCQPADDRQAVLGGHSGKPSGIRLTLKAGSNT
jgi:hypothetical protein